MYDSFAGMLALEISQALKHRHWRKNINLGGPDSFFRHDQRGNLHMLEI
jgi:hypothetical protein